MDQINLINHPNEHLQRQGFVHLAKVLDRQSCINLVDIIREKLQILALSHTCSIPDYFSAVNRWPLSCLLDTALYTKVITSIAAKVTEITGHVWQIFEADILYKSPYAALPTPCHQDIAYVAHRPYWLSTWVALTKVPITASPLQFLPASHHKPISPAVDFWQPDFIDTFRQSQEWQQQAVTLPVEQGDGFLFSSRIWHASDSHQSSEPRLALVVRWGDDAKMITDVPAPAKVNFGMWNCGEYTQKLLIEGLLKIFNYHATDCITAIQVWRSSLSLNTQPFICDNEKAGKALEQLQVLNEAYHQYNGGDGQGIVYSNVWYHFLLPLKSYLEK